MNGKTNINSDSFASKLHYFSLSPMLMISETLYRKFMDINYHCRLASVFLSPLRIFVNHMMFMINSAAGTSKVRR